VCADLRCSVRTKTDAPAAVDFISIQAMLFNGAARNWWQQTAVLVRFQTRMAES